MAVDTSILESGLAGAAAIEGFEALSEQIERMNKESDLLKKSGDPYQLMLEGKGLHESEYSGLNGLARYGVHSLYAGMFSTEDPGIAEGQYRSATEAKESEDHREPYNAAGDTNRIELLGLSRSLQQAAALSLAPNEAERQQLAAQFQHDDTLANIEQLSNRPYQAFNNLFKSQADQDRAISQLKLEANVVRDETVQGYHDQELYQRLNDEDRLKALKLQAAGDATGAGRQEIENQYNVEERSVDGLDSQQIQRVQTLRAQALANYDADAARKAKLQQAQTEDQIAGYKEEANEAQLRAEGRDDDAKNSAVNFATQQRVKSLQEQEDAATDPTAKAQIQQMIAAAGDAGKTERDAVQQEIHRQQLTNAQAPGISAASQLADSHLISFHAGGGEPNLNEAVRKLDATTAKLDKALSNSKTLVLVKD
ncbi:MAG: hypothetical protein ABSB74_06695 [Tepidisphaeraceae bacterium]